MRPHFYLFLPFLFLNVACSTMGEIVSENDSPFGYKKKNDGSGKYVRKRVIRENDHQPERPIDYSNRVMVGTTTPESDRAREREQVVSSLASNSSNSDGLTGRLGISTSFADEEDAAHFGLEAEVDFQDWLTGRLGLSIFSSDYIYWGGTLGLRAAIPKWRVSPYVGVEGYLGDHKSCDYESLNNGDVVETCEKVFLGTAYLEMGVMARLFENTRIYVFSRGYSKIDQNVREELIMFYGASFFFSI